MTRIVRIGNAHGFWGDRLQAAAETLTLEPELDFLTLDFLAEVSMSILAAQRQRNPGQGYARDVVDVVRSLAPYWSAGGRCRLITNAGGLNPLECARACRAVLDQAGCGRIAVAAVSGDDVLHLLRAEADASPRRRLFDNLDTGESIASVAARLTTANAYLGAAPIVEALSRGADLVITGRVADPSLTVGACAHRFGWESDDWNRLAGATVAGHLIECGTQVTGGIFTDWLDLPDTDRLGFPIVEVSEDGECVVTKATAGGGEVTRDTVREQLLYEIGDPDAYLSPDVTVSLTSLIVESAGDDRVRVAGAVGRPPPPTLKVSATWQKGFRAAGLLTVAGADARRKARRAAENVLRQLERSGRRYDEVVVECLGSRGCWPDIGSPPQDNRPEPDALETVLRIAVADASRSHVTAFTRAVMPLITAGPPGTTGYAEGRPRVHPHIGYWPCLVDRHAVRPNVEILEAETGAVAAPSSDEHAATSEVESYPIDFGQAEPAAPRRAGSPTADSIRPAATVLADIALARSGDKGRHANIGIIARRPEDYARLTTMLTEQRVARYLGIERVERILRFELPCLEALNFLVHDILDSSLRSDSQGKALAQLLLRMPLE